MSSSWRIRNRSQGFRLMRILTATLLATTQNGVRSAILPLSRRYRADRMYNTKRLRGKFATDTFYPTAKSLYGNKCCQIYSHKNGFAACYPIASADSSNIGETLDNFIHDFGAPEHLTFDGHMSQVGRKTRFRKSLRKHDIDFHMSGPRRSNENPSEGAIRELKRRFYRVMFKNRIPMCLWDFLVV